jgi:hypothetical protein
MPQGAEMGGGVIQFFDQASRVVDDIKHGQRPRRGCHAPVMQQS